MGSDDVLVDRSVCGLRWAALRLLRHYAGEGGHGHLESEGWTTRFYRKIMNPLILDARRRWMFFGGVVILLLAKKLLPPRMRPSMP